jgi:hypothetical protein
MGATGYFFISKSQKSGETENFNAKKARRRGLLGERYGYWYLRRQGYVFIAKNHMPQGAKGELDLVGYDGERLRSWKSEHAPFARRSRGCQSRA